MTHIEQRYGEAALWTSQNPILHNGEAGHESDTGKWKLGDGETPWVDLPYKSGVDSVAGQTGDVTLSVGDVVGAAGTASPAFSGNPTAPTRATSDNTTSIATTAFVKAVVAALVDGSPGLLDTLNELAAALGDDPNFAATVATALAAKAPLASPVFTGNPTAPSPGASDDDTSIATTEWVRDLIGGAWTDYSANVVNLPTDVNIAKYFKIGRHVTVRFEFKASGASAGGSFNVPLPFPAASGMGGVPVGDFFAGDTSAGSTHGGWIFVTSGLGAVQFLTIASQLVGQLNPFTWADDDTLVGAFTYESAT